MEQSTFLERKTPKGYESCVHNIDREMRLKLEEMLQSKDIATSKLAEDIFTKRNFSPETIENTEFTLAKIKTNRIKIYRTSKWLYYDHSLKRMVEEGPNPIPMREAYYTILFRKPDSEK